MSNTDLQFYFFAMFGGVCVWFWSRMGRRVIGTDKGLVNAGIFESRDIVPCAMLLGWYLLVALSSILLSGRVAVESAAGEMIPVETGAALDSSVIVFNILISLALATVVWVSLSRGGRSVVVVFGLKLQGPLKVIGLSFGLLFLTLPLVHLSVLLMQAFGVAMDQQQQLVEFFQNSASETDRWLVAFTAVIVAPVVEELVFRGFFYGFLKRCGGALVALLVSSALFAIVHGFVPALLPLFVLAICLALAYEFTGSLWVPTCMHALFNLGTILYLFHAETETIASL